MKTASDGEQEFTQDGKIGYIEIHPMGKGLLVEGYDKVTNTPLQGCQETALNKQESLISAILDVNQAMSELGYATVLDYHQFE